MNRRGLTLVEVVAATVVLSLLAVSVVPVLRDAREMLDAQEQTSPISDLGLLVDHLIDDPESAGLPTDWSDSLVGSGTSLDIAGQAIRVRRVASWLVFEQGSSSVARFRPVKELP